MFTIFLLCFCWFVVVLFVDRFRVSIFCFHCGGLHYWTLFLKQAQWMKSTIKSIDWLPLLLLHQTWWWLTKCMGNFQLENFIKWQTSDDLQTKCDWLNDSKICKRVRSTHTQFNSIRFNEFSLWMDDICSNVLINYATEQRVFDK